MDDIHDAETTLVRHLSAPERETTIVTSDDSDVVRIHTTRVRHIGQLNRHPAFTLVDEGRYGTTAWAEFIISDDRWSPATGAKRRGQMTDEQKAAAGARLTAARQKQQT